MEIANFIVAVSSLFATIVLTFIVYILQKRDQDKHDIERKEDLERVTSERTEELARNFIIDNQAEINLLPICVIVSNTKDMSVLKVNPTKRKYTHDIYLKFDKQPENIKREILRQEGILLNLPNNSNWVSDYLELLKRDAFECGLSNEKQCYLHNNAKYFHKGYSNYGDEKLNGEQRIEITNIPISPKHDVFGNYTPSFDDYLVETINKKFGEPSYLENDAPPALDFAYDYFQNDEKMFVLSIIQFVRSFSSAVRIRTNKNKEIIIHNDRLVETYEDYYYDALLALYLAYSMN